MARRRFASVESPNWKMPMMLEANIRMMLVLLSVSTSACYSCLSLLLVLPILFPSSRSSSRATSFFSLFPSFSTPSPDFFVVLFLDCSFFRCLPSSFVSSQCTLLLTEGDSAKALAMAGVSVVVCLCILSSSSIPSIFFSASISSLPSSSSSSSSPLRMLLLLFLFFFFIPSVVLSLLSFLLGGWS